MENIYNIYKTITFSNKLIKGPKQSVNFAAGVHLHVAAE